MPQDPATRAKGKTGIIRDSWGRTWESADTWESDQPWEGGAVRGETRYVVGTQGEPEVVKPGT